MSYSPTNSLTRSSKPDSVEDLASLIAREPSLDGADFKIVLDTEIVFSERTIGHFRSWLKVNLSCGPAQGAIDAGVPDDVPTISSQSNDGDELDIPDSLFPIACEVRHLAPNTVGILGHYLKGRGSILGNRSSARRSIYVYFQCVLTISGKLIGENFDLVGSGDSQERKPR